MIKLLEVRNLKTHFFTDEGTIRAVDGMDFEVFHGKNLAIVGESGCGKSITARSIMQIVPGNGKIVDGEIIYYKNEDEIINITELKPHSKAMRRIRGSEIAMIFQEPMNSFSPVHTIGSQIVEAIMLHNNVNKQEAREQTIHLLDQVRISRPEQVIDEYPHQLSGGMRQRAMTALGLSCNPRLLIADEPTTALDVTIQAQILKLIKDLQQEFGMAIILITHDLGVVAETADYVAVTYMGKVVESGDVFEVFKEPLHPYTRALFASIPTLKDTGKLNPIEGSVPDPYLELEGCPFMPRCSEKDSCCNKGKIPALKEVKTGHKARCFLYDQDGEMA